MKKIMDSPELRKIARVLLIVGGLNRGLLGLFNFNIVSRVFGYGFFARVVYALVGIATVYVLLNPASKSHIPIRR